MEKNNFDFSKFLISKGFKIFNANKYKYLVENDYELVLEILENEYILPFALDMQFRDGLPKTVESAEKSFKTMEDILGIEFVNCE